MKIEDQKEFKMIEKTNELKPDKTIDLKGEVCPYTFVKSKLALEEMGLDQVLEVVVDHEPAVENVPKSLKNEGQRVLAVDKINDTDWKILVRKEKDI
jgi:tRNA 2-thiouridine synthesizing protein A